MDPNWLLEMCVAPDDAALAQDEVTTAADGTPYGGEEAWALLPVKPISPSRFVVLDETQLNGLAAPARAAHCSAPVVTVLANKIELAEDKVVRNLLSELSLKLR